MIVNNHHYALV